MNKTFFARFAIPILMMVFFFVPFALRGARMSFTTMKNDVKDWLPSDYDETKDLDWFRENFLGEQFILVTWPGCNADDTRFKLFVDKLKNEVSHASPVKSNPEQTEALVEDGVVDPAGAQVLAEAQAAHERELERSRLLGDRLGLSTTGTYSENWGGRGEKWLLGDKDTWYFITPDGELYRWNGGNNLLGWAGRRIEQLTTGKNTAAGELVATLGKKPTDEQPNEYHTDPRKLTARFFKTLTTGPEVFARMAGPDGGLWPRGDYSDEQKQEIAAKLARERLSGSLFGPDGQQTCMIITLSDVAKRDLKRALGRELMGKPPGRLLQIASESGLNYDDLRLGGPPVDNVAIDEEGSITLVRLIGWSLALGASLAYLTFRSFKITIMIFFVGSVSAVISLAMVWYSGDYVDAIVMSMPSLVYVLGLTSAVHMITYYRHHCQEEGLEGAAEATIMHTWKPLLIAQLTSAIGLVSLLTSELLPIRKFGLYAALGTLATLVVMYLYLPSALQLWPPGYHKRRTEDSSSLENWLHNLSERFWGGMSGFVVRNHLWIAPAVFIFVCVMAYGTTKLKTNVQLLKMFDSEAKIIKDYAWLEQNLGRLVPMEMVVRISPEVSAPLSAEQSSDENASPAQADLRSQLVEYNFLERMEVAEHVQNAIESKFGPSGSNILGRGMSAVTFAPPLPGPGYGWRSSRAVFNRKLEQHREELLHSDYLRLDKAEDHAGSELWRISLRLGALNNVDYGEFVNDLKCVVEPVLAACRHREAVLVSLAKSRPEQGVTGARVAVIGLSNPVAVSKAENDETPGPMATRPKIRNVSTTPADLATTPANKQREYGRDQEKLFAATMLDLLGNRGFKTASNAKSKLDFIDADALVRKGKPLSSDELAELLSSYDCVVVAKDLSGCDLRQVEKHVSHVVDARDFQFDPFSGALTAAKRNDPIQAVYTGVVPVVYKAQRALLDSLVSSTNYAFVSIAFCLMILLRSGPLSLTNLINFRGGFVAMLPNIFPLIVVFGAIGYLGIEVDIGSMMTASIAIGVAVDDTIHYLEWFRGGMRRGLSRHEAIIAGYRHSGSAIIGTMLIGGLGLSVFAFSSFTPTQRFGTLMLTMLAVGVVGELLWMPSLLASPLGKYFEPRDIPPAPAEPEVAFASAATIAEPLPKMQHEGPHASQTGAVRRDKAH